MNKLFVDTNAFEKTGYKFDAESAIISALLKNVQNGEYEFCNLSIIDSEIINHITKKCEKEYNDIKKRRWIQNYISDEELKNNCYKDLIEYGNFKEKISSIPYDVSMINPETIFSKYFKFEYPFEDNKEKRKEFPDAFIAERINLLAQNSEDCVYFVTNDKGLKSSMNQKVICYDNLEDFLASINKVTPKKFKEIEKYILKKINLIKKGILEKITFEIENLDYEKLEIKDIEINEVVDTKVIDKENHAYYVSCKCNSLDLFGNFIFLETKYNVNMFGEIVDIEPEFLEMNYLTKKNYEFIIKINEEKENDFSFEFLNKYNFRLTHETIEDSNNYDYVEEDWAQDGGFR